MTKDIVDELYESDAASALTNRAAREIERLRSQGDFEFGNGILRARQGVQEVMVSLNDSGPDGTPDEWYERAFCNICYDIDLGDESVGIPEIHSWVLADDQEGTILGNIIETIKVPFGYVWETYHEKTGEIVNEGFSREPVDEAAETRAQPNGFAVRSIPVYR